MAQREQGRSRFDPLTELAVIRAVAQVAAVVMLGLGVAAGFGGEWRTAAGLLVLGGAVLARPLARLLRPASGQGPRG